MRYLIVSNLLFCVLLAGFPASLVSGFSPLGFVGKDPLHVFISILVSGAFIWTIDLIVLIKTFGRKELGSAAPLVSCFVLLSVVQLIALIVLVAQ